MRVIWNQIIPRPLYSLLQVYQVKVWYTFMLTFRRSRLQSILRIISRQIKLRKKSLIGIQSFMPGQ